MSLDDPEEVRAHLVGAASAGTPLTYSEILSHLGYRFSRPKMRQLCVTLGEVDARARAKDEPELAVLVVRASDGLPGQGWWVGEQKGDYQGPWEGPRAKALIERLQQQAFDYWAKHG
ncbi:ribose-phosphate pyrophosphokinase [Sphingomicrobium sediminis]|uniref:Ribose-phosphate pyrophosphokinase n=1 Tax=Sphingomicrobium sediminis TaxID=2950949 RepID=A0A9X2EKE9_9SPHN|nr:ribose-phosphate pyrophosphokinase [Sphingomicrobium sediminis]MCM8558466.1 ribose-phosphate pyrophosphokinase [Sphingomicrobium sediminis]